MKKTEVLILDHVQIGHKIKRIAYQIYESNVNEEHIVLAGILKSGFELAQKLKAELENISELKVTLCEVKINKKDPLRKIETSLSPEEYKNRSIVLVDDVLNSGTTLIYGVRHFLDVPLKPVSYTHLTLPTKRIV